MVRAEGAGVAEVDAGHECNPTDKDEQQGKGGKGVRRVDVRRRQRQRAGALPALPLHRAPARAPAPLHAEINAY